MSDPRQFTEDELFAYALGDGNDAWRAAVREWLGKDIAAAATVSRQSSG